MRNYVAPCAGLTALTELSLEEAHFFGDRALEALRPLASLRRLLLSHISLTPPALREVLGGDAGGEACADDEEARPPLLPGLTSLTLRHLVLLK